MPLLCYSCTLSVGFLSKEVPVLVTVGTKESDARALFERYGGAEKQRTGIARRTCHGFTLLQFYCRYGAVNSTYPHSTAMNHIGKYILANVHFDDVWAGTQFLFVLNEYDGTDDQIPTDIKELDAAKNCLKRKALQIVELPSARVKLHAPVVNDKGGFGRPRL